MITNSKGFFKERFPELKGDSFDCGICYLVSNNPKECLKCGTMYCGSCIDDWASKHNECPIGCKDARTSIKPIAAALSRIYKNLDIKCQYQACGKVVKMCDLEQHEASCQLPQCEFFAQCGSTVKNQNAYGGACSPICEFMKKIKGSNGDWKLIYNELKKLQPVVAVSPINNEYPLVIAQPSFQQLPNMKWNPTWMGQGIVLSMDGKSVYLKENGYLFKTVLADTPMMGGTHYWEIVADSKTENELKIGVSMGKDFNYNTAFCDFEFGFAYYGLGQLRQGSNSSGGPYGKKFKKTGNLGVYLDMNKGTLSFALDGDYWGVAFKNEKLKKGPAYAAVALLHQAGCSIVSGKPAPAYFLTG